MHRLSLPLALRSALCASLLFVILGCSVATQQVKRAPAPPSSSSPEQQQSAPQPTEADKIERATSEPYVGDLKIFEDPARERKLQINRVMDILGIKEGSSVADIGAGSGWFTVRAARRAGASGTVYAVEINKDYLKYIERRAAREKLSNIQSVLGKEDDLTLPARSIDAVMILKTYHEIAEPIRVLKNLRASLRPDARVGVIDRNGKGDDHGIDREQVVSEAERAGFALVEEHDFVKPDGMDYFLVFRVKS